MATTERDVLEQKVLPELQAIASSMGVQGYQRLRKADLIGAIIAKAKGVEFTPSPRPSTSARAVRPFGTTLRTTRDSARRQSSAARCSAADVGPADMTRACGAT